MNSKCPHCGIEYEIDKSEYGMFVKCETCGKGFVVGQSVPSVRMVDEDQEIQTAEEVPAIAGKVMASMVLSTDGSQRRKLGGNDFITRYQKVRETIRMQQKALDEQLKVCELRNAFFEQVSIFECDWEAYGNATLPKRIQLIIDGLRAKIANAHSSVVASAVAHAEASLQVYGTTVGLRDPNSSVYLIARDIVQAGGWGKMVATDKQLGLLNGSIEDMTASLSYYESLMLYYYDLCEEFKDKDEETARRDRLRVRCGFSDECSLPLMESGKDETILLKEREELEDKKRRLESWLRYETQSRIGRIASEAESSSMSMFLTCALVVAAVLLILIIMAIAK